MTLNERLDLIEEKILSEEFRSGKGLGNEINFWIFDYDAKDEMAVRSHIDYLINKINNSGKVNIVHHNLYDMAIDALKDKKYLERVIDMEKSKGSEYLVNPIKRTLRLTLPNDIIVSKIYEKNNPDDDIIFISGVGSSYPIIRSHTILNNLHSKINKSPLIMFFPGVYEGELRLFGEIKDDNYYRAFRLIER